MTNRAFVTGINGQDGSYLAELLLEKGYEVHGLVRRASNGPNLTNIERIKDQVHIHYGDMTDCTNVRNILLSIRPNEIYNLAAQSHVGVSFQVPASTGDINGMGVLHLLEATRTLAKEQPTRFYQASTSELYGKVQQTPQTETTPFYPRSPYAVAKLYAYWMTVNYRESYNLFACNGILFNHESPRRGPEFVTRKITQGLASAFYGGPALQLGNLDAWRDWGHARDYVQAMWLMLQQDQPEDYVIATGQQFSVREFCEIAAEKLSMKLDWVGTGLDECGIDRNTGRRVIEINKEFYRPAEVNTLLGDATKAKEKLGWVPETSFQQLVEEMIQSDLRKHR
jgi:GDPmannose 4,6-dehydratase